MATKMADPISREEYMAGDGMNYPKKKRKNTPLGCLIAFLVLLFALIGVGAYFGNRLYQLYNSAKQVKAEGKWMMAQITPLKKAVKAGDEEALDETVQALMEKADWIYAETHSELWEWAAGFPTYGEDIRTAQTLGEVAVTMTHDILYPLSREIGGIKLDSVIQDGRINVELIQSLPDLIDIYLPLIDEQLAIIEALPPAHIDKLQEILDKIQDPLEEYRPLIELAEKYLPTLPPMLGADGQTRTYLVIAMGNSEIRSAGGFPGAWGTIEVTDGAFELGEFVNITHENYLNTEPLAGEEIYNLGIFTTPGSVTAMPNFNRTGELARDYWGQYSGQWVDGVIAIDPVALQYLLALTGEFDTSDGTHIDGTNAAYEILHNVYVRYWNWDSAHDAFFAEVASKAASTFFANIGKAKLSKLIDTMKFLGEQGRIQVWMVNDEEEELVRFLGFSGEYSHDPLKPVVGLYLNNRTYGKIDWFLQVDAVVSKPTYNSDGTVSYDVSFTLTNNITYDFAYGNTIYITGVNSNAKRDRTDMILGIVISLPEGAYLDSYSSDPEHDYWIGWPEGGIPVIKTDTSILGGTSSVIRFRITIPAEEGMDYLTVHVTPLAQEDNLNITYQYQ